MASQMRNWFLHLSPREIDGLLQKLLDYDKKRRVNYEEGLASKVESDMILMMNQLGQLIEKEDSLFRGSMMQCGSSYNRTKVIVNFRARCQGVPEGEKVFDSPPPPHHMVAQTYALKLQML